MTTYKNNPYWVPPDPIKIIIGSQSDDVIGQPIFFSFFDEISFIKNQDIDINHIWLYKMPINMGLIINLIDHIVNVINERAKGLEYEESGWGLEHAAKEQSEPETKQEINSLMDELERLGNMYEKGLLTDEEFTAIKNKLIGG